MNIVDLLTNRTVEQFTILEHGLCSLKISGGYAFSQEALLRYVGKDGIFICAPDDKQLFGLSSPYDAEKEIKYKIEGKTIKKVEVKTDTGDIFFTFDEGRIEIICMSRGYEAWQLYGPDNLIMVGRGGCEIPSHPCKIVTHENDFHSGTS